MQETAGGNAEENRTQKKSMQIEQNHSISKMAPVGIGCNTMSKVVLFCGALFLLPSFTIINTLLKPTLLSHQKLSHLPSFLSSSFRFSHVCDRWPDNQVQRSPFCMLHSHYHRHFFFVLSSFAICGFLLL